VNHVNHYPNTWAIRSRVDGQDQASGGFNSSSRPGAVPFAPAVARPPETRQTRVSRGTRVVWVAKEVGEDIATSMAKPRSRERD
jgi:hypothetical protein